VFDQESGRQLEIPLGSTLADLVQTNVAAGRYLLYPVDQEGNVIPGVVAMTEVSENAASDDDEGDEQGDGPGGESKWEALAIRQSATLEKLSTSLVGAHDRMMAENTKAVAALVGGYVPVRAVPPPAPVVVDTPAPLPPQIASGLLDRLLTMKPDEMMQLGLMVQNIFGMVKGAMGGVQGGGAP
jgi:hypothetical protein